MEDVEAIVHRALEPVREILAAVGKDAREARDGMISLTSKLDGQDISTKIDRLGAQSTAQHSALRVDMNAAVANLHSEIAGVSERVKILEADKEKREGGNVAIRMLRVNAGWFVGVAVSAAALFDKLAHK